jgi:iron complex outermembrane receptor protein
MRKIKERLKKLITKFSYKLTFMRPLKYMLAAACLLFVSQWLFAQITISGKVTDAGTGAPLADVSVRIKSSQRGTFTNRDGLFSIMATSNDVLEISFIGYKMQTVAIEGRSSISIVLTAEISELNEVVFVGTRGAARAKTETPVPVDVIKMNQVTMPTARMDITSIINYAAPSFNYNKQSGSDGADHVDLATLRGLSPDQTLVLVNGKRRHQTAFVAIFGTRGRGASGTDLNALPAGAIDRVEILRDGASAQYGSDAIAGVINIILKKDVKHFSLDAGYSGYYDHKYNTYFGRSLGQYEYASPIDGNTFNANASYGLPIGKNGGFISFSGNFSAAGKTFRQVLDTSNIEKNKDGLIMNFVRKANGDGSLTEAGGFFNMEIPVVGLKSAFYAFGGINRKWSDAFAFTRDFNGNYPYISAHPDRFPTDNNGNLVFVPSIMKPVRVPGAPNDTIFNPHIQTHISDVSLAAGIRGVVPGDWNWDLSNSVGRNDFHYFGDKTFNASFGAGQTHFDDGGFNFLQNTTNLDFSKKINGVAGGFNLALGAEFRYENYKIYTGEEGSYKNYNPSKASGSQGYPGYQPSDAVNAHRNVLGAYADAELDVTKFWLIGGAVRAEHYSDFGSTLNFKLDSRYKVTDNFNLRSSVSTGFRAPSLAQINFSNTFTTVQGSQRFDVKIAPNYSPITKAAGIPDLKQEKSVNASLGFSWQPLKELTITIDGYWVRVKDRVVLSGQFSAGDSTLDPNLTSTLNQLKAASAQFFANAVNTSNRGIDIVLDYRKQFGRQHFNALLTGNVQHMTIDRINVPAKLNDTKNHQLTFLNYREQNFILASAPPAKFGLGLEYGVKKFSVGTRLTYFGKIDLYGYGSGNAYDFPVVASDADPNVNVTDEYIYKGKVVSDLYFSYHANKKVSLFWGADNIFNVHPDYGFVRAAKGWAFNNETGGPWDAVQMGDNGIRLFARVALNL